MVAWVLGTMRLDCQVTVLPSEVTHGHAVVPEALQVYHMEQPAGASSHWDLLGPWAWPWGCPQTPRKCECPPPRRPPQFTRQEILIFTQQTACRRARSLLLFFFLNDNFSPLFFVAKNHPGLSRREGRKLCGEREGKIISLGHRHSRLSSVCRRRGEGGRACWDARPRNENEGWPKSITVLLALPGGAGGQPAGRQGGFGL